MAELRPAMHRRTASHESSSSGGSFASRLILEHILNYPGTYELPLRTMYALNSAPRAQLPRPKTPGGVSSMVNTGEAAQRLTSSLMAEISQMPNQPNSLPPAFITSFVRKCFASELSLVDFPQALTGLDYLKDLETRRRREMQAVLSRVGITIDNAQNAEDLLRDHPEAYDWYKTLEDKTSKVEVLYAKLHVALRRWILINEMSLEPFNKSSCIAMLNTVYPPMGKSPAPHLSESTLNAQRETFFKYITAVERSGPNVLSKLVTQGKRGDEQNGWPATRETLDEFLMTANNMIDECISIGSSSDVSKRANRKADSGVSFLDSRKNSSSSEKSIPSPLSTERPVSRAAPHKSTSTLEKLAREIRHLKRNKTDVSEMIPQIRVEETEIVGQPTSRSMRKMKSLSSLNLRRSMSRNGSVASTKDVPKFDVEEMKKQRLAYDVHMMAAAG
ncbi:Hypothetical protein D9617_4g003190 [Elsinoe fawcettii]|nr:Hypothetical protein D9617_4g003190 [Elsinoe fawcettii]